MIRIDEKKCIGCGSCEAICPKIFKIKNGKAKVIFQKDLPCIKESIEVCPVNAISA